MLASNDNMGPRTRIFFTDEIERLSARIISLIELPGLDYPLPSAVAVKLRLPAELKAFPISELLLEWHATLPWCDDIACQMPGRLGWAMRPLAASCLNPSYARELHALTMGGISIVGAFVCDLSAAVAAVEDHVNGK